MINDDDTFLWDSNGNWHYCRFCTHLQIVGEALTCEAFPEGIPKELASGLVFHSEPMPMLGQKNDIVFAPRYK